MDVRGSSLATDGSLCKCKVPRKMGLGEGVALTGSHLNQAYERTILVIGGKGIV